MSFGAGPILFPTDDRSVPFLPHLVPRLGLDLVLLDQMSLGVAGGYGLSMPVDEDSTDKPTQTAVLSARLGYLYPTPKNALIWTRMGPSYAWGRVERRTTRMSLVAVNIELVFVMLVTQRLAITLGLGADLGLYGTDRRESGEVRRVHDGVAMWLGVLGFL